MSEDLELTPIDVKDTSVRLKIEFQAYNIQKIMIMQKKSKDNWQNILEKKIEYPKITELIEEIRNLEPASKYKFQAILTTNLGQIIQVDEVKIITRESKSLGLSAERINLMQTICDEKKKLRIGFVGPKNSGKSSIIRSIVSIFNKEHNKAVNMDPAVKSSFLTSDAPLPNTNITLVEYNGTSDQEKINIDDIYCFLHGFIPTNAALNGDNDTCQSGHIPVDLYDNEQRKLDALVIIASIEESQECFAQIRTIQFLATRAGIRVVVFITKTDLFSVSILRSALFERRIMTAIANYEDSNEILNTDNRIGHYFAISCNTSDLEHGKSLLLLSTIKYLIQKPKKQRVLKLLIRSEGKDIFIRCYLEKKSFSHLLEVVCKTFVRNYPPSLIYELKNGLKIDVANDYDVEELKDDALIEFKI